MNKNRNKVAAMMMVVAITVSSVAMPVEAAVVGNEGIAIKREKESEIDKQSGEVKLDKETFPDDYFRKVLAEILQITDGETIPEDKINIETLDFYDPDKYINPDYILKIEDLKGIENFKNLKTLKIGVCRNLKKLNLSQNSLLKYLYMQDYKLEKLDLTQNKELETINIGSNEWGSLKELLLPEEIEGKELPLKSIDCRRNKLSNKLDLSKFKGLTKIDISENQIPSLILPENNEIKELDCRNNELRQIVNLSECNKLEFVDVSQNNIKELDLSGKKNLKYVKASNNKILEKVDLSNCELLKEITLYNNKISNFNIKGCKNITDLDIRNNEIKTLDISENKNLDYLAIEDNPIGYVKGGENLKIWNSNKIYIYLDIEENSKSIDLDYYFPGIEMDKLKIKNKGININGTKLEWKGNMPTIIRYEYIVGGKNNTEVINVSITLSPYGGGSGGGSGTTTPDNKPDTNPDKPNKPIEIRGKIVGKNRYETAAKIADQMGSYNTVILVNSDKSMADGLSAASLSGKKNAPILLVKKNSIPSETMARLEKAENVYIIGGNNVISKKVENQLKGKKITRISGKDRYDTSAKIANLLGDYDTAFIVNGAKGEADAMSVSSVAAKYGAPILLTNGKTSKHLKKANVRYFVIGGKAVVSRALEDRYDADRISGVDRYSTNRKIIDEFYYDSKKVYFAKGDTLVDALAVSALAKEDGVVLVSKKANHKKLEGKKAIQVGGMDFEIDVK